MAALILTTVAGGIAGSFGFSAFATAALKVGAGLLGGLIDNALRPDQNFEQEGPRLDEVRFTGSAEGVPIHRVAGRMRTSGNIIWTTKYREVITTETTTQSGGKGGGPSVNTTTTTYTYFVSFALAICEGPILRFGRIWTDGAILDQKDLIIRPYLGTETQLQDSKIVATEGSEYTSAYRGVAYLVFEEFPLEEHGNRIPQMNVEVYRSTSASMAEFEDKVKAITLIPSSGEFAYGTTEVTTFDEGAGTSDTQNRHSNLDETDFVASIDQLEEVLPNCVNPSLVVAWHGTDLRMGHCELKPKVEIDFKVSEPYVWEVSGLSRADAEVVSLDDDDRPNLGGASSDRAAFEAIQDMNARGMNVTFYPFILMDIEGGNALPDPYGGAEQSAFPWRGRITLNDPSSDDETSAATTQAASFFGSCAVGDFGTWDDNTIPYTGPAEWSFRRMILHYAKLCAAAGGVDTFIIGSEMVELNRARDNTGAHPAVDQFKTLAADVRSILGGSTTITYAADWSEWANYRPSDGSNDILFHLDPLWTDSNIDVIGIDNYMPLSDWRDTPDHLDAANYATIYDKDYLKSNIAGGELFDWFYASTSDRHNQVRSEIVDNVYARPWDFKIKDLVSWWQNTHHDKPGGLIECLASTDSHTPDAWNPLSITRTADANTYGPYSNAASFASSGSAADNARTDTAGAGIVSGESYEIGCIFKAGTSNGLRLYAAVSGMTNPQVRITDIVGEVGGITGSSADSYTLTNLGSGFYRLQIYFTATVTDSTVLIAAGPNSSTAGEDVIMLGAWMVCTSAAAANSTDWEPESKPIWFTELGCPAIDKGPNQPNVFVDPKSSESFAPYYSTSDRDDFIQRQYNVASIEYWAEGANNPTSSVYAGTMVDDDRMYIWTWDTRPFPEFPYQSAIWSDGDNWELGHWLNGRAGMPTLKHFVDDVTSDFNVTVETDELYGLITGFLVSDTLAARGILQPLMTAYFFDAYESEGKIKFRHRGLEPVLELVEDDLVADDSNKQGGPFKLTRGQLTETPREVRAKFILDDYDYTTTAMSARRLIGSGTGVSETSFNLVMSSTQGQSLVDTQLVDAHVQREVVETKLPPSLLRLDASDIISLNLNNRDFDFRLDRLGYEFDRPASGTRTEAGTYKRTPGPTLRRVGNRTIIVGLSNTIFMDIPMLNESDIPHAPWIASSAIPWPGGIAVHRSATGNTFTADNVVAQPSVVGLTKAEFSPGPTNTFDNGNVLRVEINSFGTLQSLDRLDVFAGGNACALYNSAADEWEIIQWTTATLTETANTWELSGLLRGQLGSEHAIADPLPINSRFVVIDTPMVQSNMSIDFRNLALTWQYGPIGDALGDTSYTTTTFTPRGVGLRPLSPCSLSAAKSAASNDVTLGWLRRTRIGGETWDSSDVPLSEDFERYEIDILDALGTTTLRTIIVNSATTYVYPEADQITDFGSSPTTLNFEVFQISGIYGRGAGRTATKTFNF